MCQESGGHPAGPLVQGVLQVWNQGVKWDSNLPELGEVLLQDLVAAGRISSLPAVGQRASISHLLLAGGPP